VQANAKAHMERWVGTAAADPRPPPTPARPPRLCPSPLEPRSTSPRTRPETNRYKPSGMRRSRLPAAASARRPPRLARRPHPRIRSRRSMTIEFLHPTRSARSSGRSPWDSTYPSTARCSAATTGAASSARSTRPRRHRDRFSLHEDRRSPVRAARRGRPSSPNWHAHGPLPRLRLATPCTRR
jgi:hypothetical protein